jgi:hypothetical protein
MARMPTLRAPFLMEIPLVFLRETPPRPRTCRCLWSIYFDNENAAGGKFSLFYSCPAITRPPTAAGGRSARVEPRVLPILRLAGRRCGADRSVSAHQSWNGTARTSSTPAASNGSLSARTTMGYPAALGAPGPRRSLAAGWRVYPHGSAGLFCSASRRGTEQVRARPARVCCLPPIPRTRGAAAARDLAYGGKPRPLKPERHSLTPRTSLISGLNPAQFFAAGRGRRRLKAWQRWKRVTL